MKYRLVISVTFGLLTLAGGGVRPVAAEVKQSAYDWKKDWATDENFSIGIDTQGWELPSAIVFVPNPGSGAKDPLYFVTELRGKVKVVTNDRSIYTFAEKFFTLEVEAELPSSKGQGGLAGICLDPAHGYVFVTFAYQDQAKTLRNSVIRFETTPGTFGVKPAHLQEFTDIFAPYRSGLAHQIGACQVQADTIFVSVGEAWQSTEATNPDTMVGKIMRMTLDGQPLPDNPFYEDNDVHKARNFVWARGFRNPFGQKLVDDRLFVADNGQRIDRFIEVKRNSNFLWNGNDWAIASNALFVFAPSVAPVQLDFLPPDSALFPEEYRGNFYLAASGNPFEEGKTPGIVRLKVDFENDRLAEIPSYLLKYQGKTFQSVVGLAVGPDALYFAPIMPNAAGATAILKMTYRPAEKHPYQIMTSDNPTQLMVAKGCFGCHKIGAARGYGGTGGPNLEARPMLERLSARLNTDAYINALRLLDGETTEPLPAYKSARAEVAAAAQGNERLRAWMKWHLLEPRFDNPWSQMPNTGLSEAEALLIADFLLTPPAERQNAFWRDWVPAELKPRHLAYWFVGGLAVGVVGVGVSLVAAPRARRLFKRGNGADEPADET